MQELLHSSYSSKFIALIILIFGLKDALLNSIAIVLLVIQVLSSSVT